MRTITITANLYEPGDQISAFDLQTVNCVATAQGETIAFRWGGESVFLLHSHALHISGENGTIGPPKGARSWSTWRRCRPSSWWQRSLLRAFLTGKWKVVEKPYPQ